MPLLNAPQDVRGVLKAAMPDLVIGAVKAYTRGCDSLVFEVNGHLIFKFPRTAEAAARLQMECGILAFLHGRITIPVPLMEMIPGPVVGSVHEKLPGSMIETAGYDKLPDSARDDLAARMAGFYAELHEIPLQQAQDHGAGATKPWLPVDVIAARSLPGLPRDLAAFAGDIIEQAPAMLAAPDDTVFGFFDGQGWNMAFDHAAGRLNGIYDFADCGFARRHFEFHCSNWISPDLTVRIIDRYRSLTGIPIETERVMFFTALMRLNEHASGDLDPARALANLRQWRDFLASGMSPAH